MSSSVSDSSVSSSDRESSGEMTEKNGFSVVAATSVTQRFSTPGRSASCWALVNRCTSSMNSTVSTVPVARARSRRAPSITCRTSFTPAVTADSSTNFRFVWCETTAAIVVFPVPGGPQSSSDIGWSPSTSRRNGEPGASRCCCPTSSSRLRGRIRTASGAAVWSTSARLPPPRAGAGSTRKIEQPITHTPSLSSPTDTPTPTPSAPTESSEHREPRQSLRPIRSARPTRQPAWRERPCLRSER